MEFNVHKYFIGHAILKNGEKFFCIVNCEVEVSCCGILILDQNNDNNRIIEVFW